MQHDARREASSSACARTPTSTPSSATRARRSKAGRSTRSATSSCTTPSSTGSTLIPAGTPHASGAGNVVLEISATPYLYTLRFYDWLRRDLEGTLRPVHLEHAFANLDPRRRGAAVRARPRSRSPTVVRSGAGWARARARPAARAVLRRRTGSTSTTRSRTTPAGGSTCSTSSRASEVDRRAVGGGPHGSLAYAETLIVPAAVGPYRLRRVERTAGEGDQGVREARDATPRPQRSTSAAATSPPHASTCRPRRPSRTPSCGSRSARTPAGASCSTRSSARRARSPRASTCSASPRPARSTTSAASARSAGSPSSRRSTASTCGTSSPRRSGQATSDLVPQRRRGVPARRAVGGRRARTCTSGRDHARHGARLGVPRRRADRLGRSLRAARRQPAPRPVPRLPRRGRDLGSRPARAGTRALRRRRAAGGGSARGRRRRAAAVRAARPRPRRVPRAMASRLRRELPRRRRLDRARLGAVRPAPAAHACGRAAASS